MGAATRALQDTSGQANSLQWGQHANGHLTAALKTGERSLVALAHCALQVTWNASTQQTLQTSSGDSQEVPSTCPDRGRCACCCLLLPAAACCMANASCDTVFSSNHQQALWGSQTDWPMTSTANASTCYLSGAIHRHTNACAFSSSTQHLALTVP